LLLLKSEPTWSARVKNISSWNNNFFESAVNSTRRRAFKVIDSPDNLLSARAKPFHPSVLSLQDTLASKSSDCCGGEMSCPSDSPDYVGDGWCDHPDYNIAACNWDGGDCCPETCVSNVFTCGIMGYFCLDPRYAATEAPSSSPSAATQWPSLAPTQLPSAATESPTFSPTFAPSVAPTQSPPLECLQFLSFDDSHGSYETWMTSFIKFEGNFAATDDDDDFGSKVGYLPFLTALEYSIEGTKPAIMLRLRSGPGASFGVVSGKLDSAGSLMPCEIQSAGSGPCLESRDWEIGLSTKSFLNSLYSTETSAWIAPYGSSMTSVCSTEGDATAEFPGTVLRPRGLTGEARSHNNVRPPSYHVPPPLPHESLELSLTLRDGAGFGWWNTLKFHPNQYVLDNGEDILHRGTLVGKAEDTEKVISLVCLTVLSLLTCPCPSLLYLSSISPMAPTLSACWAISMSMPVTTLGP
jgi:hypothetical protein